METAEKLITENLDVWTSAVKAKSSAGRGSSKKRELYGNQKLRGLILDLAVRGLLVSQNSDDEPAAELLKKIASEKANLVKKGKIKKLKAPTLLAGDEEPYRLPNSWQWFRLAQTGLGCTGKTPKTSNTASFGGDIQFIGPGQITPNGEILRSDKTLTEAGIEESTEALAGDILMVCIGGSIGKSVIAEQRVAFNQQINAIRPISILSEYLNTAVSTDRFYRSLLENATGSATPIINRSKWENLLVPIPPAAEQHRIVAKVDELMALCDQLEQEQESNLDTHDTLVATLLGALTTATANASQFTEAWQRIQANFDTLFTTESSIDQLKQTILQLAVMGKLVEQDPEDEPTRELLQRILKQRRKQWNGKRKYKEPNAPTDSKPPYLPKAWTWVAMEQLGLVIGGLTKNGKRESLSTKLPYLRVANVYADELRLDEIKEIGVAESELEKLLLQKGDLLVVEGNGSKDQIGRLAIWDGSIEPCVHQNHLIKVRLIEPELGKFVVAWMLSPSGRPYIERVAVSGSGLYTLSVGKVSKLPLPLPPLAEQHRIVAKVDELMALCDQLKASLATAQATQLKLADSLVEQAVG